MKRWEWAWGRKSPVETTDKPAVKTHFIERPDPDTGQGIKPTDDAVGRNRWYDATYGQALNTRPSGPIPTHVTLNDAQVQAEQASLLDPPKPPLVPVASPILTTREACLRYVMEHWTYDDPEEAIEDAEELHTWLVTGKVP